MDHLGRRPSDVRPGSFPNGLLGTLIVGSSMLLVSCGAPDTPAAPAVGVDKPVASAVSATLGLPESPSGYYGVYTSSSVVLFGKLVRADKDWVTLADVYSIRSNVDPAKKTVENQLVRRKGEWHQPGESAIARQNILVIEPVAQDSRMMTLIREMK